MKIPTLLCATACALLLAGGAAAHETGKPHKHRAQKAQTSRSPRSRKTLTRNTGTTRAARRRRSATTAVASRRRQHPCHERRRAPSPRLRGEGWGEGQGTLAYAIAPHPTSLRSVDLSPQAGRGEVECEARPTPASIAATHASYATRSFARPLVIHGSRAASISAQAPANTCCGTSI